MKVDNPSAFRFLLNDELYLLPADKIAVAAEPLRQHEPAQPEELLPPPIAIVAETIQPLPIKTPETAFNYLGGNNKNFVILLNYPGEEIIPAAHLTALQSMLQRKGFGLDDVAIINVNRYAPLPLAKLAELFKPVKLLIMGSDALPQGIGKLPLNQPVQGKKTSVLYSFSFAEMMDSNEMKKTFWDQMKAL